MTLPVPSWARDDEPRRYPTVRDVLDARYRKYREAKAIHDAADGEDRDLTRQEERKADELLREVRELTDEYERRRQVDDSNPTTSAGS